jgi:hypothetical protein
MRAEREALNTYFAAHEAQLRVKGWGLMHHMHDEFVASNPNNDCAYERFKKAASKYRRAHGIATERAHGTYYERRLPAVLAARPHTGLLAGASAETRPACQLQICELKHWVHEWPAMSEWPAMTRSVIPVRGATSSDDSSDESLDWSD